jgi:hypothetical protein
MLLFIQGEEEILLVPDTDKYILAFLQPFNQFHHRVSE